MADCDHGSGTTSVELKGNALWVRVAAFFFFPVVIGVQWWLWSLIGPEHLRELARHLAVHKPLAALVAGCLLAISVLAGFLLLRASETYTGKQILALTLKTRRPLLAGLVVLVLGFYITRYASVRPFLSYYYDGAVSQDTFAVAYQAKVFAEGKLWAPDAGPCFDTLFVVRQDGRQYGKYPPVTPLFFSMSQLLFKDLRPFAIAVPLASALLIGLLAAELFGGFAGVLAPAIWLVALDTLLHSASVRSDPVAALLALLAVWAALRLARGGSTRWLLVLVVVLVLQANNKAYDCLIIAAGLGVYSAFLWRDKRQAAKYVLAGTLTGLFAGFAIMLGVNWLYTGAPFTSTYQAYTPWDKPGLGPRQCYQGIKTLEYTWRQVPASTIAPFDALNRAFSPLGLAALLLGLPLIWRKRKSETALIVASTLALVLYGTYWYHTHRYGFVMTPLVAVLLAGVVCSAHKSRLLKGIVLLWLLVQLVLAPPVYCAFCHFHPVATPQELAIIHQSQHQPTLVFLSPPTASFQVGWGAKQPAHGKRLIGLPNTGLGAITPDPTFKSSLIVAVDRGSKENAKVIARLPGRRVLRVTYQAGAPVMIEPYQP